MGDLSRSLLGLMRLRVMATVTVTGCAAACLVPAGAAAAPRPIQPLAALTMRSGAAKLVNQARELAMRSRKPATIGVLPRVLVGGLPQMAAFDPATRTVYVANQADNTLSVVNARTCNGRHVAGCGQLPVSAAVGSGPNGIAIDDATHTIYVTNNSGNTVSVIDAATCNATRTSGCGHKPATVTVGAGPTGLTVDPATDTVYVTDGNSNSVSVINGATCNATRTAGCGQKPATVHVGHAPFFPAFDRSNQTVYVTDALDNTVSMINARRCHAGHTAGCGRTPPTAKVGGFPIPVAVDQQTHTVYVGNGNDATVSVLNAATCNATQTSGCAHRPVTLQARGGVDGMALNEATGTLFVSNNGPGANSPAQGNTVLVVNAATCNAETTSGCGQRAPVALVGANPAAPAVDEGTDTTYVPTFDNTLAVVNGATCNAPVRTGCGQTTPATLAGPNPFSVAVNPASRSVYAGDVGGTEGLPFELSVLDAATCNTIRRAGCTPNPPVIPMQFAPLGVAIDQATNTVYATNSFNSSGNGDTVSVINGATCNATVTTGCRQTPPMVKVGKLPVGLAVDRATDTIYVANIGGTTVSVINGATCNSNDTSGCGRTPARVHLGTSPVAVAIDQATDTIYALNPGTPSTVSVINGTTCNGTVTSGCGQTPPTVTVGNASNNFGGLEGLAVDATTNTVYVVNAGDGTVSVINGAICNSTVTTGCGQTPAHVNVGRQGYGYVAVDPATGLVYVSDNLDDTISIINGNTCNGKISFGCRRTPPAAPVGANPAGLAVDQATHTLYADDNGGGTVSFFRFQAPQRPTGVVATAHYGKVDLRWQPPYAGGLPVVYQITPIPACPACRGLTTPSTSGLPFTTITGLRAGQRYRFKVRATDAAGTGRRSTPSNPVTP
jgi:YVTN family beta-propeller protein